MGVPEGFEGGNTVGIIKVTLCSVEQPLHNKKQNKKTHIVW